MQCPGSYVVGRAPPQNAAGVTPGQHCYAPCGSGVELKYACAVRVSGGTPTGAVAAGNLGGGSQPCPTSAYLVDPGGSSALYTYTGSSWGDRWTGSYVGSAVGADCVYCLAQAGSAPALSAVATNLAFPPGSAGGPVIPVVACAPPAAQAAGCPVVGATQLVALNGSALGSSYLGPLLPSLCTAPASAPPVSCPAGFSPAVAATLNLGSGPFTSLAPGSGGQWCLRNTAAGSAGGCPAGYSWRPSFFQRFPTACTQDGSGGGMRSDPTFDVYSVGGSGTLAGNALAPLHGSAPGGWAPFAPAFTAVDATWTPTLARTTVAARLTAPPGGPGGSGPDLAVTITCPAGTVLVDSMCVDVCASGLVRSTTAVGVCEKTAYLDGSVTTPTTTTSYVLPGPADTQTPGAALLAVLTTVGTTVAFVVGGYVVVFLVTIIASIVLWFRGG